MGHVLFWHGFKLVSLKMMGEIAWSHYDHTYTVKQILGHYYVWFTEFDPKVESTILFDPIYRGLAKMESSAIFPMISLTSKILPLVLIT